MKLQKIEKTSVILRNVCRGLIVPVIILPIVASAGLLTGRANSFNFNGQSFAIGELGMGSRLILVVAVVATAAVLFMALCHLSRLLGNYSRREIFTTDSARVIRRFGFTCMLWGAVKALWFALPLVVSNQPPQSYDLSLDAVLMGTVIVGLSWFAEMAAALREDNDLTI